MCYWYQIYMKRCILSSGTRPDISDATALVCGPQSFFFIAVRRESVNYNENDEFNFGCIERGGMRRDESGET